MELKKLELVLSHLNVLFDKKFSSSQEYRSFINIYAEAWSSLLDLDLERAAKEWMHTKKHYPSPIDLIELVNDFKNKESA